MSSLSSFTSSIPVQSRTSRSKPIVEMSLDELLKALAPRYFNMGSFEQFSVVVSGLSKDEIKQAHAVISAAYARGADCEDMGALMNANIALSKLIRVSAGELQSYFDFLKPAYVDGVASVDIADLSQDSVVFLHAVISAAYARGADCEDMGALMNACIALSDLVSKH